MDARTVLVILHIIGTALGVGAASVSDMLFFLFSKDGIIDQNEFKILNAVANIVWAGLGILLFTGFALIIIYAGGLSDAHYNIQKVWAKVVIVTLLAANGFVMHRVVLPLMEQRLGQPLFGGEFAKKAKIVFSAGAISMVSWYGALILGGWRNLNASFMEIMTVYLTILGSAIIVANIVGIVIVRSQQKRFAPPVLPSSQSYTPQ